MFGEESSGRARDVCGGNRVFYVAPASDDDVADFADKLRSTVKNICDEDTPLSDFTPRNYPGLIIDCNKLTFSFVNRNLVGGNGGRDRHGLLGLGQQRKRRNKVLIFALLMGFINC